jgi:hypothetical protein
VQLTVFAGAPVAPSGLVAARIRNAVSKTQGAVDACPPPGGKYKDATGVVAVVELKNCAHTLPVPVFPQLTEVTIVDTVDNVKIVPVTSATTRGVPYAVLPPLPPPPPASVHSIPLASIVSGARTPDEGNPGGFTPQIATIDAFTLCPCSCAPCALTLECST